MAVSGIEKIVVLLNSKSKIIRTMTGSFSVLLKKYSVPIILFVIAIGMLIFGISNNQDSLFMVSSILMFAASGISILYSSGKFKPMLALLIGLVAGVIAVVVLYISYKEVSDTNQYKQNYEKCKLLALQNLEDIRYVQKVYAEQNGTYLKDWDEFIDFVRNGKINIVDAQGVVPNRRITDDEKKFLYGDNRPVDVNMTEEEAFRLSKWKEGPNWQTDFANFKRDTLPEPLMKVKFNSRSYLENRDKLGFYAFNPDSLPFIPFTKKKWKIETRDSVLVKDIKKPALRISGKIPFAKIQGQNNDSEEMFFGDLNTAELDGSWENE